MLTILIVDDKPENIFALESLLERPDRRFLQAENGKQCLKTALQEEIDLIVLDVQMPEMDGFEVAQILKSNKRTKDIPIIFASAEKKEQQFMMKGFEEGAVDYLFKPLDPEITKAKVSVLLKLQRQKKELLEKNMALEQSALLINNSADIIGILDPATWKFIQVNHAFAATLGYTAEEVKNLSIPSVLSEEGSTLMKDFASRTNDRLSFETPVHTKQGEEKYLQWHVVVKDGCWFVNVRDVTSQRKAEESISRLNDTLRENLVQLESANKELESFSYSVSHDLRAPLRSMDGYTKILQEEYGDRLEGDGKRYLVHILNNTRKMGNLIEDLLKFSRMGRKDLQKSEVAVERLVRNMLNELLPANGAAEVKLGELPPVHADYSLLTQVWTNLLSNALKYSSKSEQPVVEVGSERQNGEVIYYVRDNGVGFDMRYADKLFGVFQRMHKPEDFEGTGVGLAIVQRIVAKHGGRVWATAEVNKGATFYFALPDRKLV